MRFYTIYIHHSLHTSIRLIYYYYIINPSLWGGQWRLERREKSSKELWTRSNKVNVSNSFCYGFVYGLRFDSKHWRCWLADLPQRRSEWCAMCVHDFHRTMFLDSWRISAWYGAGTGCWSNSKINIRVWNGIQYRNMWCCGLKWKSHRPGLIEKERG